MPPPSPRPSGRGVALLSSVPAPYPSSPECLPVPASLWLCLPPPWDPAQLPSPHCVPSTDGLCVSLALVRPATACLRVSCVCLPCLGLSPSLGLCVCLIRAWSSLSNLSSLCLLDTPSPRPCLRLSLPPFRLRLIFSLLLPTALSLHLCTDSVSVSVASPTPFLSVCFTPSVLCLRLCHSLWSLHLPVSLPPPHLLLCCSALQVPGTAPLRPGTPSHDVQGSPRAAGTRFPPPPLPSLPASLQRPRPTTGRIPGEPVGGAETWVAETPTPCQEAL